MDIKKYKLKVGVYSLLPSDLCHMCALYGMKETKEGCPTNKNNTSLLCVTDDCDITKNQTSYFTYSLKDVLKKL